MRTPSAHRRRRATAAGFPSRVVPPPMSSPARGRPRRADCRTPIVLVIFAAAFLVSSAAVSTRSSAIRDEPIHLTAGYGALARGDFRIDPSHPPLLRMWAALPTVFVRDASLDSSAIDGVPPASWLQDAYLFAHRFMYEENDADRLLHRGRLMMAILGVALGFVLFLPGYVAISTTTLSGVYAPPSWRLFYKPFEHLEPVATTANDIRIYRLRSGRTPSVTWSVVPIPAGIRDVLGNALAAHGRLNEALAQRRIASQIDPARQTARVSLARLERMMTMRVGVQRGV
jgi:hypothetical protein